MKELLWRQVLVSRFILCKGGDWLDWLSLFPGASRERPRFIALAEAVLRQVSDFLPLIAQWQSGFSFAEAEGIQLDQIAGIVGLSRADIGTDVSDETFREYLLTKLALWTWDGTNKTVPDVLTVALPGSSQTDNRDGTVTVYTGSNLSPEKVFPVPAGVEIVMNHV